MNLEQLINQFELVTDTEDGLEQLRKLILSIAVRGSLVSQDPNAEPAKKLLEKIETRRQHLYEEGEIRKPKTLPKITEDEIPFEIPNNWEWCRLGNIAEMINGDRGKNYPSQDVRVDVGIPFINAGNLEDNKIVVNGSNNYITEKRFNLLRSGKVKEKDILYCLRGSLGKMAIVNDIQKGAIASSLLIIRLYFKSQLGYIVNLLKSGFGDYLIELHDNGTAQPNLSATSLKKFIIPLPPLEEQQRIVQKIETLFSQVDELELKVQQDRVVDERLQLAVLDDLQRAETPEASKQSWQRLTDHFEQIYRKPEHIDQLKQAILNEAVRGRLVPQDPNDEPAKKLLERIKEEKQRLYEEGEIRKPKDLPEIKDEEIPYELLKGWVWCRFGDASINKDADRIPVSRKKREDMQGEYPYYGASGIIDYVNDYLFEGDHLLIGEDGANLINRSTPIAFIASGQYWVNNHAHVMDTVDRITMDWLRHYINSINLEPYVTGTAQPKLNQTRLNKILIALPPLDEQGRIHNKVEGLFAWCDNLKDKLSRSQQTDQRLLEALVNGV